MKIRVETTYIAESGCGEKPIPIGGRVKLIFQDGQYHTGDIEAVSEESVTISRADGEYTYSTSEITDIQAHC